MDAKNRFIENLAKWDYINGTESFANLNIIKENKDFYTAERDSLVRNEYIDIVKPRLLALSTERIGDRYVPHDITYNAELSERDIQEYRNNPEEFLERKYRELGNGGVQPFNFYGHSPSVGDAFVIYAPEGIYSHYVSSFGFVQELDLDSVMTLEQQKMAVMGMDIRDEFDLLEEINAYTVASGEEQLLDEVIPEIMGRLDFIHDNFTLPFNLAAVREVQETEQHKLSVIGDYEDLNEPVNQITYYYNGKYYFDSAATRSAMPDSRLVNGNYVYDDHRIVAGERLRAEVNRRFENIADELRQENDIFYSMKTAPHSNGLYAKYDSYVQRYKRGDDGVSVLPDEIVYIGYAQNCADVANHLTTGGEYGNRLSENINLRAKLGEVVLSGDSLISINELEQDNARLTDLYYTRFDRMVEAMRVAGNEYDNISSSNDIELSEDYIVFNGEYGTRMEFSSLFNAEEWLNGVVFDDPEVSDAVEKIMHPERIEDISDNVAEIENATISFFVAESMEFHSLGEYHEGLTLQEAFDIYDSIPEERLNGGKGIGFDLHDGSMYEGGFDLVVGTEVQEDLINEIEHYRNSPLVQQAIRDCKTEIERRYDIRFNEAEHTPVILSVEEQAKEELIDRIVNYMSESERSSELLVYMVDSNVLRPLNGQTIRMDIGDVIENNDEQSIYDAFEAFRDDWYDNLPEDELLEQAEIMEALSDMGKYIERYVENAEVQEHFTTRLEEIRTRRVPGHYPEFKSKEEVDNWIEFQKKLEASYEGLWNEQEPRPENIFDADTQVIVNPVNLVGVMGAGLAKDFKEKYPDMFERYKSFCDAGNFKEGQLYLYKAEDKWILNFPTKRHWRDASDLSLIEAGLKNFVDTYEQRGITSITFPKIGTGLGGLDWETQVEPLMHQYLDNLPIRIEVCGEIFQEKREEKIVENNNPHYTNSEAYRFFYDNEDNLSERNRLINEEGWKQIWGSDEQGLNGGTWVLYRDISGLPEWLQDYASRMEQVIEPHQEIMQQYSLDQISEELERRIENDIMDDLSAPVGTEGLEKYSFNDLSRAEKRLLDQDVELTERVSLGENIISEWERYSGILIDSDQNKRAYDVIRNREVPVETLSVEVWKALEGENSSSIFLDIKNILNERGHDISFHDLIDGIKDYRATVRTNDEQAWGSRAELLAGYIENTTLGSNPLRDNKENWFFNDKSLSEIVSVYYNEYSNAGGQLVEVHIPYDDILAELNEDEPASEFIGSLEASSRRYLIDVDDVNFKQTMDEYLAKEPAFKSDLQLSNPEDIKTKMVEAAGGLTLDSFKTLRAEKQEINEAGATVTTYGCRVKNRREVLTLEVSHSNEENGEYDSTTYRLTSRYNNVRAMLSGKEYDQLLDILVDEGNYFAYTQQIDEITANENIETAIAQLKEFKETLVINGLSDNKETMLRDYMDNAEMKLNAKHFMLEADGLPLPEINNPSKGIVFDTETTGFSSTNDEILQLSIVDLDGNELYNSYIKPYWKTEWSQAAEVHGITPEMLENAPYPHEVLPQIKAIFDGADTLVAYNADFDIRFLKEWGINFEGKQVYDVMKEFAPVYGEVDEKRGGFRWQKLGVAAEYYGFEFKAHDSLEDIKATLHCYNKLKEREKEMEKIRSDISENLKNKGYEVSEDIINQGMVEYGDVFSYESTLFNNSVDAISVFIENKYFVENPLINPEKETGETLYWLENDVNARQVYLTYYNPDAESGGQFVNLTSTYNEILLAKELADGNVDMFFEEIERTGYAQYYDIDTPAYKDWAQHLKGEVVPELLFEKDSIAMEKISLIAQDGNERSIELTDLYKLAQRFDAYAKETDPYGYNDMLDFDSDFVWDTYQTLQQDINSDEVQGIINYLKEDLEEYAQDGNVGNFTDYIREAKDLLYSIQHLDEYYQFADGVNARNLVVPIKEFHDENGRILEGNRISIALSNSNYVDRTPVFEAVRDYEEKNAIPYAERVITDGSYEDKEFLYDGYDKYIGATHEFDLSIQKYIDRVNNIIGSNDENGRTPRYHIIAEIYYAQELGLDQQQINYMLDKADNSDSPYWDMRTIRNGFEYGLSEEELDFVMSNPRESQEYLIGYMTTGGSFEDAKYLEGIDSAGAYYIVPQMKDGFIKPEVAQAIIQTANFVKEANRTEFDKMREEMGNEVRPRFYSHDIDFLIEELSAFAVQNPAVTPQQITAMGKDFYENKDLKRFSDYLFFKDFEENHVRFRTSEEVIQDIVKDLKDVAKKSISKAGDPRGAWFGRIADPQKPENYIDVSIMGYYTRDSVIETATLVVNGVIVDSMGSDEINWRDYVSPDFKTGLDLQAVEYIKQFDNSLEGDYVFFNNHGIGEHRLEKHYRLLADKYYPDMPIHPEQNKNIEMHNELSEKSEKIEAVANRFISFVEESNARFYYSELLDKGDDNLASLYSLGLLDKHEEPDAVFDNVYNALTERGESYQAIINSLNDIKDNYSGEYSEEIQDDVDEILYYIENMYIDDKERNDEDVFLQYSTELQSIETYDNLVLFKQELNKKIESGEISLSEERNTQLWDLIDEKEIVIRVVENVQQRLKNRGYDADYATISNAFYAYVDGKKNDYIPERLANVVGNTVFINNPVKDNVWFMEYPTDRSVQAVSYNPDSQSGGQLILSTLSYDLILEAHKDTETPEEFWAYLDNLSLQEIVEIDTDIFSAYIKEITDKGADFIGKNTDSMNKLIEKAEAGRDFDNALNYYTDNKMISVRSFDLNYYLARAEQLIYCYKNEKSFDDFQKWTEYQELLDEAISFDEYIEFDATVDEDIRDIPVFDTNRKNEIKEQFNLFINGEGPYHRDKVEVDKMDSRMVETNVGTMPIEDYREIVASQHGFDSYDEMYKAGYRIGNGYDIEPEKEEPEVVSLNERLKDKNLTRNEQKELVKKEISEGINKVLNSENYKSWLNTSSRLFYKHYSFNNAILIWMQQPNASYTMGYKSWNEFGRHVKAGEKGLVVTKPKYLSEKESGQLWKDIQVGLNKQAKKYPEQDTVSYKVRDTIEISRNKNNIYSITLNGNVSKLMPEAELKDFIYKDLMGKYPESFGVTHTFDYSQTEPFEHIFVKELKENDIPVMDDKGKPIKDKNGNYKVVNTPERQKELFNTELDMSVPEISEEKAKILYESLKAISERNGIPVREVEREEDSTLKNGADGYYTRTFTDETPKGYIVMPTDLKNAELVSVLIHEMTHSELHQDLGKLAQEMGVDKVPSHMREIQAESVAYMVGQRFGIETDTHSFQYLAVYTEGFDMKALEQSFEIIYNECNNLTLQLQKELEGRGYSLDLSELDKTPMDKEQVAEIAKEAISNAVTVDTKNQNIEKEIVQHIKENSKNEQVVDVIKEQALNIDRQNSEVSLIKDAVEGLTEADNLSDQQYCIAVIEGCTARIDEQVKEFDGLSKEFIDLTKEKNELKNLWTSKPEKAISQLKDIYPPIENLSKVQIDYIAKSEYINRELTPLLRNNPEQFAQAVCERASQIENVASKNNMFVEIAFCEQWFEEPIFNGGEMMHPKVADSIISKAETQIAALKEKADEDDFVPYSKCHVSIYQANGDNSMTVYKNRVDIGDGSQSSLVDFLKQTCMQQNFTESFIDATSERGANQKIVFNETKEQPAPVEHLVESHEHSPQERNVHVQDKKEVKFKSGSEWNKEIDDRKQINKSSDDIEKNAEKSRKSGRDARE